MKNIAIIGGGAAGFFLAIHAKQHLPTARVLILERSRLTLQKLRLSGGGRCNVTNTFRDVQDLAQVYPRGHRLMKRCFARFDHLDIAQWFKTRGVSLLTQADQRIFPASNDSDTIALCLEQVAKSLGVELHLGVTVRKITPIACETENSLTSQPSQQSRQFRLTVGQQASVVGDLLFDAVALTTGGAARGEHHDWLSSLGHQIETPCPSLFTFTLPNPELQALTGLSVETAQIAIAGTKFRSQGPLLITHWGVSGPAVLKLSAHAARYFQTKDYRVRILISWIGFSQTDEAAALLEALQTAAPNRSMENHRPEQFVTRLWSYLLQRAGIDPHKKWSELSKKARNKLASILTADEYEMSERALYKDEFVTCGGVSLQSVNPNTLESRCCPGLFFAGEVLDVDGITGGFNFSAAFSTAFSAAQGIYDRLQTAT